MDSPFANLFTTYFFVVFFAFVVLKAEPSTGRATFFKCQMSRT